MKNIGVAVIGLGGIGTLRAHSCAQIPQVGHLAICDINPDNWTNFLKQSRQT